jgi:hypothetical protein
MVPVAAADTTQWLLWGEGWPVAARPTGSPDYQLGRLIRSGDRLALVASVWKLHGQLIGDNVLDWPPIPIARGAYKHLAMYLQGTGGDALLLLERTFQPIPHRTFKLQ